MATQQGARGQGDSLLRSGRAPEWATLLAPTLLIAAVAFAGVGAGGIDRLASLGEIATGPAPASERPLASRSSTGEVGIVRAPTHRSHSGPRPGAVGGEDVAAASAGSAGDGSVAARAGVAVTPVSPPASGPADGAGGGRVRESVGRVRDAAPVPDRAAPIERVIDELLDDRGSRQGRLPPALRKLELGPED
jgi:hypothetical protein